MIFNNDSLYEKCYEAVQNDPLDFMLHDDKAEQSFFEWMDEEHKEELQGRINEFLETADGKAFFLRSVEWLMKNRPENDDHDV